MATVIFKPTENCNARCIYCDVVRKKPMTVPKMNFETLELFFERINEFLLSHPQEDMYIIWHGGEPLLLGPKFFEKALEFQKKHCVATSDRIRHAMQSNLTLFTPEYTDILKKLGIHHFGTSYDPVSSLRGLGTKVDADAYNRRFIDSIELIESEGFDWGLIYVVTKYALKNPIDVFSHLTNFSPNGSIMFNPVLVYDKKKDYLSITPEEFVDFLGAIFPLWWRHKERYPLIDPFRGLERNLLKGERALSCADSGGCSKTHMYVGPNGRYSHCGRAADWNLIDYGNIYKKSFAQVFSDPQREVLDKRNKVLPETDCKGCRFWEICHGGCPLDALYKTRSFLHKTGWCRAKKDFIEKYFEPVVNKEQVKTLTEKADLSCVLRPSRENPPFKVRKINRKVDLWINPLGGLGDALMVSGVLKQISDKYPKHKFNMVTRTKYDPILRGHPAISHIGHPPPGAESINTNYWDEPAYGKGNRAYQIMARMFGLETPVPEQLYVPWKIEPDSFLAGFVPWKKRNVLISPSSISPRKQMSYGKWESLVESLKCLDMLIVQAGNLGNFYIRGAYSLVGITNPRELINLMPLFDAVITADNFIMHAAHLCGVPAIVLWGPTDHRVYGYEGQIHLQAVPSCGSKDECIGPGRGELYHTKCPEGSAHCLEDLSIKEIRGSLVSILDKSQKIKQRSKNTWVKKINSGTLSLTRQQG